MGPAPRRKLIEVSLPLEAINRESTREKSIRHGHPSTLHLWWARRPLAAARAVLFAQLVDDPSSHPDRFPTEEDQRRERERLHALIEQLVVWENTRDETLLTRAHAEILTSTGGNPPPILDPFAGGGTIPLEAQRLGLEAHASDLNPVAVLINKALIEIPPTFRDRPPVFPGLADTRSSWKGAEGLAADVRAYGRWMRDEAERRIGHLYPKATLPDGTQTNVIAWIWARTVTCPNPACGVEMPLVRSWWLGRRKGKEAYVVPRVVADATHPSGRRIEFSVGRDSAGPEVDGTVGRTGAECVACHTAVGLEYVRSTSRERGLGSRLMATVAEGTRSRVYLAPDAQHAAAADVLRPDDLPPGELFDWPGRINVYRYGLTEFADLFTNRQLVALTTFSDLVGEIRERVLADATSQGLPPGERLEQGGSDAAAYADAVATYLGLTPSGLANLNSTITTWRVPAESPRTTFSRQALPMAWDFVESNSPDKAVGVIDRIASTIEALPPTRRAGFATQASASAALRPGPLLSTDPPYYDNIGYSDLSDYFYVWLRRTLRTIHPALLGTLLVPKNDELVANPYRHGGKERAHRFFEDGFHTVFAAARPGTPPDLPVTVYYAFKQSESTGSEVSSSGWETLLESMIRSGWTITATWPVRTEAGGRMISVGTNALASSIVLALRPRPEDAAVIDRRGLIAALHDELPDALRKLQQGGIAPVDLPQAAIGPGMAVFSRYARVIEADGSPMTVRSALARINEILDQVLTEQEGDLDPTSRFALAWYRQHGYTPGTFGDADNLARARNTSVALMDREQILTSRAGRVQLIRPAETSASYDPRLDPHTSSWEALHHLIRTLETDGVGPAGAFLRSALSRPDGAIDADLVKELGHLLFRIAEANSWTKDALSFNTVVTSWPDIVAAARANDRRPATTPSTLDFTSVED